MTLSALAALCTRFELKARLLREPDGVCLRVGYVPLIDATAGANALADNGAAFDDRTLEFMPDEHTACLYGALSGVALRIEVHRGPRGAVVEV